MRKALQGWLALAGMVAPGLARAQELAGGAAPELSIVRVLAALLLCLAATIAMAMLLRRHGLPRGWPGASRLAARLAGDRRIEVIETRRLATHAELCLVRCGDHEYLILCGPSDARVLPWPGSEPRPAAA